LYRIEPGQAGHAPQQQGSGLFPGLHGSISYSGSGFHQLVLRECGSSPTAVIRVMSAKGDSYAPFEAPTMDLYATVMERAGIAKSDIKIEVPGVQQALIALQDKKLVWKASRGVYAVDEQVIVDLLRDAGLLEGLT
jgi:hypothetical protein